MTDSTDDGADQPLAGVRILDLTGGIAGPLGVLLLAEHGADVIKVEPPGGEPFRNLGTPVPGHGKNFQTINRGKRSVLAAQAKGPGATDTDIAITVPDTSLHLSP